RDRCPPNAISKTPRQSVEYANSHTHRLRRSNFGVLSSGQGSVSRGVLSRRPEQILAPIHQASGVLRLCPLRKGRGDALSQQRAHREEGIDSMLRGQGRLPAQSTGGSSTSPLRPKQHWLPSRIPVLCRERYLCTGGQAEIHG